MIYITFFIQCACGSCIETSKSHVTLLIPPKFLISVLGAGERIYLNTHIPINFSHLF